MLRILFLIVSVCLSAVSIYYFDIYTDYEYNKSFDYFKILSPGIFFSIFILYLNRIKGKQLIIDFFSLLLLWIVCFLLIFVTRFLILIPIATTLSANCVNGVSNKKREFYYDTKHYFTIIGFIVGLLGIGGLYLTQNLNITLGFRMMCIIAPWQIGIGSMLIRQEIIWKKKEAEKNDF